MFWHAIAANAAALILAHNHPSGDRAPSEADIKVTRDLIRVYGQAGAVWLGRWAAKPKAQAPAEPGSGCCLHENLMDPLPPALPFSLGASTFRPW